MKKKMTEMPPAPTKDERTILDLPGVKGAFGSMDGLFRFGAAVMESGVRRRERSSKWVECFAATPQMIRNSLPASKTGFNVEAIETYRPMDVGETMQLEMVSGATYIVGADSWKLIRKAMGFDDIIAQLNGEPLTESGDEDGEE